MLFPHLHRSTPSAKDKASPAFSSIRKATMQSFLEEWEWCVPCKISFTSERASKKHQQSRRHLQNTNQQVRWHATCRHCGKLFGRNSDRERHETKQQCRKQSVHSETDSLSETQTESMVSPADVPGDDIRGGDATFAKVFDDFGQPTLDEPKSDVQNSTRTDAIELDSDAPPAVFNHISKARRGAPTKSRQYTLNTALCLAIAAQDDASLHYLLQAGASEVFPATDYLTMAEVHSQLRLGLDVLSPLALAVSKGTTTAVEQLCENDATFSAELRSSSYLCLMAGWRLPILEVLIRWRMLDHVVVWDQLLSSVLQTPTVHGNIRAIKLLAEHGSCNNFVASAYLLDVVGQIAKRGLKMVVEALLPLRLDGDIMDIRHAFHIWSTAIETEEQKISLLEVAAIELERRGSCFVHMNPLQHLEVFQLLLTCPNQKWSSKALELSRNVVLRMRQNSRACDDKVRYGCGDCPVSNIIPPENDRKSAMEKLRRLSEILDESIQQSRAGYVVGLVGYG